MSRSFQEVSLADVEVSEHVRVVRQNRVSDLIDPRISLRDIPTDRVLDTPYHSQIPDLVSHRRMSVRLDLERGVAATEKGIAEKDATDTSPLYVEFEKDDPRDPVNYSTLRKWTIILTALFFTCIAAASTSSYNLGFPGMIKELNCTEFQATIGLSTFTLGFAVAPLVTASLSEEFGRHPLYVVSAIGYALTHLMVALARNIQTVLVARFLSGAFSSTAAVMVGGSIADIFMPHERSLPMSIFSVATIGCTGLGAVVAGWIEMNPHLGWRWIQWLHLIFAGIVCIMVPIFMKETRSAVVLTRIAKKLRKTTGDPRYRARVEDERASLKTLIWISCTRPVWLLFTEPVVASFSIWIGFAWGILYVLIESIGPVFTTLHNFNNGEVGVVFVTFFIGSVLGIGANMYQEKLYKKHFATRGPEARLYLAMATGISFAAGLFIFAWCTFAKVFWISLCIAITIIMFSSFTMYLAVFTYLADCYGTFASSALAGQSLSRNLFAMAFPLFTEQMFAKLTFHWANTLFGCLAAIMIPIPFILFYYGPALRARSKFAVSDKK